jgi:hypothetical protein
VSYDDHFGFRNDPTDPVMQDRDRRIWEEQLRARRIWEEQLRDGYGPTPGTTSPSFVGPDPAQLQKLRERRAQLVAEEEARKQEARQVEDAAIAAEHDPRDSPEAVANAFLKNLLRALERVNHPGSSLMWSWYARESSFRFSKTRNWEWRWRPGGSKVRNVIEERFYQLADVKGPEYNFYGGTMRDPGAICLRLDGSRWLLMNNQLSELDQPNSFGRTVMDDVAALVRIASAGGVMVRPPALLRAQHPVGEAMAAPLWTRWEAVVERLMTVSDPYAGSRFDPDANLGPSQVVDVLFSAADPEYPKYRQLHEGNGFTNRFHQHAWPIWSRPDGDGLPLTYWLLGTWPRDLAVGDPEGVTLAARRSYSYTPEWFLRDFERVIAAAEERASQA